MEQVTLEVPGISPNARHIYEKLGLKQRRLYQMKMMCGVD